MEIVLPDFTNISLFVSTALALLLIPGPAVLYIVGCSIEHGRLAGLISIVGIHMATLVHVAAAALGLSALLASSVLAFNAVKYAGAIYLCWLGLKKLFGRDEPSYVSGSGLSSHSSAQLLRDGFLVNLLNPKTALFFLAFLPQFADASRGNIAMQIALLGVVYTTLGIVTDSGYALAAGSVGTWSKGTRGYLRLGRYGGGILLIGLGLSAALVGKEKH